MGARCLRVKLPSWFRFLLCFRDQLQTFSPRGRFLFGGAYICKILHLYYLYLGRFGFIGMASQHGVFDFELDILL